MKKLKLAHYLFVLTFLVGCQQGSPTTNPTTDVKATKVPTVSITFIASTTPRATLSSEQAIKFQCPEIVMEMPKDLNGKIVIEDHSKNNELYFYDLSNNTITSIQDSDWWYNSAATSPNRKIIAYQMYDGTGDKRYLAFSDADKNILKVFPWQDSWDSIVRWFNDDQLAIFNSDSEQRMVQISYSKEDVKNVNLDKLGYPDFAGEAIRIPFVEYDPTFQRVVYPSIKSKHVLVNVETLEILAEVPAIPTEPSDASWSSDGKYVAVVGGSPRPFSSLETDEIYILSRDGGLHLTHLAEYYGASLQLLHPTWSPDGRYVAFWESDDLNNNTDWKLTILDVNTDQVTNYCISTDYDTGTESHWVLPPAWSPDSKQIVVESYHSEDDNGVILIDILNNRAIEIAENASPIGWMVSP